MIPPCQKRPRFALFLLLGMLTLTTVLGCGSGGGSYSKTVVTGKVTLDGAPLPTGHVVFHGDGKLTAIGEIQPDGTYRALNVPKGDAIKVSVKVRSLYTELQGRAMRDPQWQQMQMMLKQNPERFKEEAMRGMKKDFDTFAALKKLKKFPAQKYEKPESSGLTVKVEGDEVNYDIELTSK